MEIEAFVSLIPGARRAGAGWVARCPAHEDRRASFSIAKGQNGRVLVRCHAGCELKAILDALGLRRCDLFADEPSSARGPKKPRQSLPGRPVAEAPKLRFPSERDAFDHLVARRGQFSAKWCYRDVNGNPVGYVVRWDTPDGKDLRPVSLVDGYWELAGMPKPRPIYNLPGIINEPRVIVVEGEKAAESGIRLGFPTTTSANGSQAANQSDWSPLRGKQVIILPDNDAPGMSYARAVTKLVGGAPVVLQLPGLPDGGDLADWAKNEKYPAASLKRLIAKAMYQPR